MVGERRRLWGDVGAKDAMKATKGCGLRSKHGRLKNTEKWLRYVEERWTWMRNCEQARMHARS